MKNLESEQRKIKAANLVLFKKGRPLGRKRKSLFEDYSVLSKQELVARLGSAEFRALFNEWQIRYSISNQVKQLRNKAGWTIETLANKTGLCFQTLVRIENLLNYKAFPKVESLVKIASAFDVALIIRFVSWAEMLYRWIIITPQGVKSFTQEIKEIENGEE